MTTVAAMQCVEKGLLDLDDDVTTILPEWKFPDILTGFGESGEPTFRKATKTITLRQLLTHSAGMGYDFLSPKLIEWVKWRKIDVKALDGDIVRSIGATFEACKPLTCSIAKETQDAPRVRTRVRLGILLRHRLGWSNGRTC